MHDTVTKLLDYAEGYARAYRGSTYERHAARQALQAELVKLFTPLTDEHDNPDAYSTILDAMIFMQLHGITGEKNGK